MEDQNPFDTPDHNYTAQAQNPATETKLHHHLISGEIFALEDEGVGSIKLNTVLVTKEQRIVAMDIGKAQKALQMHFFKRRGGEADSTIQIVDVFISAISYLGYMKPSVFSKMDTPTTGN